MLSTFDKQVGGDHYKDLPVGPTEFSQRNKLGACESAIVKYVCRHKQKGQRRDLEKVIHYAQMLIEIEYGGRTIYKHIGSDGRYVISKSRAKDGGCVGALSSRQGEQIDWYVGRSGIAQPRLPQDQLLPEPGIEPDGHTPEDHTPAQWYEDQYPRYLTPGRYEEDTDILRLQGEETPQPCEPLEELEGSLDPWEGGY